MNISITAEPIFKIGSLVVTNSVFTAFLVVCLASLLVIFATRKMRLIPRGTQNIFEYIVEALLSLTDSITKDRKFSEKIFPLILTFFVFILFNNWFGLIPGVGTIGFHEIKESHEAFIPILRSGTADLNTTVFLGLLVVITTQVIGIGALGVTKYGGKFLNFSSPINFFVGILELISEFVKIIAFAFRLFGNVFAGEVLLTVISMLVPYLMPAPFYAMEVFVGFVQALVFTMLALVFFSMARMVHEVHNEEEKSGKKSKINSAESRLVENN